jgi:hypothetical protein
VVDGGLKKLLQELASIPSMSIDFDIQENYRKEIFGCILIFTNS